MQLLVFLALYLNLAGPAELLNPRRQKFFGTNSANRQNSNETYGTPKATKLKRAPPVFQGPTNERQKAIVRAFQHAWSGYKKYAWGHDELRPVSKRFDDSFGLGLTIIDSLDTAIIMGLEEETRDGVEWIRENLNVSPARSVNVFETTIRVLGGLLSGYHLTGEEALLEKATQLGDNLIKAFTKSSSLIPKSDVNLDNGNACSPNRDLSSLAEATTLQLEFRDLTALTGDQKYEDVAFGASEHVHNVGCKKMDGLCPFYIDGKGEFKKSSITLGARADSYYEYLIKQWLQTKKSIDWLRDDFIQSIAAMKKHLYRQSQPNSIWFLGEITELAQFYPKMDHLVCFLSGSLVLSHLNKLFYSILEMAPTRTSRRSSANFSFDDVNVEEQRQAYLRYEQELKDLALARNLENELNWAKMERAGRSSTLGSTDDVELEPSGTSATIHLDMTAGGGSSSSDFNPFGAIDDVRFKTDDDLPDVMAPPFFSKYGDFHTIDWQRDLARDRLRHKMISKKKVDFPLGLLQSGWDAGAGWICVLFVGLAAGATAGIIDIGARWMSDLKTGVCADRFWLDHEHCCWSSNDTFYKDDDCKAWTKWPWMLNYYNSSSFLFLFLEWIFYIGWAVAMSTLAVLFVKIFAPYACGSGIPEIKCILSGFVIRGYLGKWTFIIKSVGLILSSASGLSLGKEGPMVHLACCIGNIFSYLFPKYGLNEAKKREILSASAAAGVSVAFGAPIGGVLFSLEEASYYFPLKTMWRSFFCALVAGIILRFVNPFGSNQTSLFHVDYMMKWTFIELVPFAILGLFGGIIGSLFIFANIRWSRFRKNSKMLGGNPIYEVMLITLVTAAISYFNPFTRKSAQSMIQQLFDRCEDQIDEDSLCDQNKALSIAFGQLLWALIFKFVITIFTFGIKVPCGLFVPSIGMGAIAGRILGITVDQIFRAVQATPGHSDYFTCQIGKDCVMPGLYAMVGAAAVLGGVTRMTVSLVVIMFELTGSLEFIVPTMVATMFSKWIGDGISKMGIYEAHIELNGYPFLDSKGEYPYSTVASQVMRPSIHRQVADEMSMSDLRELKNELSVITESGMTLGDLESLLRQTDFNGFPVVVSQNSMHLVGFITRRDILLALHTARKTQPYVVTNSIAYFSDGVPDAMPGGPAPLRLRKILDMAPMTVTDQTPMETVIDMFRKLGLRHVLVTKNGKVLGIITKKDILQFMRNKNSQ